MNWGTIYWVNLEPASPPEFGKVRPGVIVSNSTQNHILKTVVIVPLSSLAPEIWPLRLAPPIDTGLKKTSFAVLPGIRQISKSRLEKKIGHLDGTFSAALQTAMAAYLSECPR